MKNTLQIVSEAVVKAIPELVGKLFDGILIRDIGLADVLIAIESKKNWPPYRIGTHGLFFVAKKVSATPAYISTGILWNLSLPLNDQSEDTLKFLAEILK